MSIKMESLRSEPITEKHTQSGQCSRLRFAVCEMQGWRGYQEDAHCALLDFDKHCSLFAVFDGHGGAEVSKFCSQHFPPFLKAMELWKTGESVRRCLIDGFLQFDKQLESPQARKQLKQLSTNREIVPGFDNGTTACVAVLYRDLLYVANIGDSRCVLSRSGKAIEMSVDHKPDNPEEKARIIVAGGSVKNGRINQDINISRTFGDFRYKKVEKPTDDDEWGSFKQPMLIATPDVKKERIQAKDDFMILACDGIWNSMESQAVVDFVSARLLNGESLSAICESLLDHCLAPDCSNCYAAGADNMTVILVQFLFNASADNDDAASGTHRKNSRNKTTSTSSTSGIGGAGGQTALGQTMSTTLRVEKDSSPSANGGGNNRKRSESLSLRRLKLQEGGATLQPPEKDKDKDKERPTTATPILASRKITKQTSKESKR